MQKLMLLWIGLLLAGCATQVATKPAETTRQRFIATPHDPARGQGANWTALHQFPGDPAGVLMVMAHAGIGDTFPVQEAHGPKLFEVTVVAGDDDRLKLEVCSAEGTRRFDLRRDATVSLQIAQARYSLAYPSVTVAATGRATTDKAMILVHRLP